MRYSPICSIAGEAEHHNTYFETYLFFYEADVQIVICLIIMERKTFMDNQTYQLELKQIVEFPRCRIYRDFIWSLITNKGKSANADFSALKEK